jgi:hypothetical protein
MRAYDLTVTGSAVVSGSTTLTGDITYDDLTATGNIITTGANKVISGSSTSTGSFGALHINGKVSSIGIGTTTPDYTLDVAGNVGFDEYIYQNQRFLQRQEYNRESLSQCQYLILFH